MKSAESRELVEQFLTVFSSGDIEKLLGMMTEDATWWVAGTLQISKTYSREEFGELLKGLSELCVAPIKLTPIAFTCDGDRVAVEAESYADTKAGKTYNNFYHLLFVVKNGKVQRIKEYLDTMHTNDVFFN